jgi:tetratricopeptide (TPR) repeat protein
MRYWGKLSITGLLFIILITNILSAQTFYSCETDNYIIKTDESKALATELAVKMEKALVLFNGLLHFDLSALGSKLRVTIFKDKAGFDKYLTAILGNTRKDFAYIHYTDISKSELVGFKKENPEEMSASLLHQGFIQLFKTFITNPPLWLREGLASYIESAEWNGEQETFTFRANQVWLKTLKDLYKDASTTTAVAANVSTVKVKTSTTSATSPAKDAGGILPLDTLFMLDKDTIQNQIDTFYSQAWGLVSFLINTDKKEQNRLLWDALGLLKPAATLEENSGAVLAHFNHWMGQDQFKADYLAYVGSLRSYSELITDGVDSYNKQEWTTARTSLEKATAIQPDDYIPYYYLGLINYETKDYQKAEAYYTQAFQLGAEPGMANYALGVNAFANNQFDKASNFLLEAKKANPDIFGPKVDPLLERISTLR